MAERRPGEYSDGAASHDGGGLQVSDGGSESEAAKRAERLRLDTLREYRIMDTPAEPAFDRVTKMVAELYGVPIALVSLVDEDREWFKSSHGLDETETQRDLNFCHHVVAAGEPIVATDVMGDPRFQGNPPVIGDHPALFYAGVPLRAYNGAVLGALCLVGHEKRAPLTATELERLEDFGGIIMAEADLRRIGVERDDARRMLERALDFSGIATWQLHPQTGEMVWKGAVAELFGADYETALITADDLLARMPPEDRDRVTAALEESQGGGHPYSVEHRLQHPERGMRWIASRGDWDVWSNDARLTGISIDITEQKSRQENANLLMRELHHRMRNLFATVSAIISLTRHAAHGVDDYVERISSRLDALNRAQNVLLGANFMTGSMHALMREVEAAFPRIRWSGPDLLLPENALVAMALFFNELATNAAKYGALTGANGQVDVSWTQDAEGGDDRMFRLTWAESGGDREVVAPDRTSFGTLLMERSVKNNLGGTIERHWEPGGLIVDITLPARWREA